MDPLLDSLNEAQREAVLHGDGPLLVLAGAGTGKTRVIVHRVAHLVRQCGIMPWQILAVTFTNKAAGEMRERLTRLLGPESTDLWVMTFHAFGARFLRREAEAAGLPPSFPIYDDTDQMALMKRLLREARLDEMVSPRDALSAIDRQKNQARSSKEARVLPGDHDGAMFLQLYKRYESALRRAGAVDFGDLLMRPLQLLESDDVGEEVRKRWTRRFRYVLVDEFQDTNPAQYRLMRHLGGGYGNICVVGDDDQAIYRWRGADVSNILDFDKDFAGTRVVKLERNYRSTRRILDAAHAVISRASRRREKKLWTEDAAGEALTLLVARDEHEEAQRIAGAVRDERQRGTSPQEIAVLYRMNAQSRAIEAEFRAHRIPYIIVRGKSFYERAEIKDAAAYLRLTLSPRSDLDFERVVNRPARGIGDTTMERLRGYAGDRGVALFDACQEPEMIPELNSGAQKRLAAFRELIAGLHARVASLDAGIAVQEMLVETELIESLKLEGTDEALERAENLLELVTAAREFDERAPGKERDNHETPPLAQFLEEIALLGEADAATPEGRVAMMTLHAAKGLEFEAVLIAGMEEGTLPHARFRGRRGEPPEPTDLDEERRLCYVGMTRAKRRLILSMARRRMSFGENGPSFRDMEPSRFLGDLPPELFGLPARAAPSVARGPVVRQPAFPGPAESVHIDYSYDQRVDEGSPFIRGSRVRHQQFGPGVVVSGADSAGPDSKVTVRFESIGEKRVLARFLSPG